MLKLHMAKKYYTSHHRRINRHSDHQVMVRSVQFKNGQWHWELRCHQCDAHIQYLSQQDANRYFELMDTSK